jgi:hypothetical protein
MCPIDYNKAVDIVGITKCCSLSGDGPYMISPNGLLSEIIEAISLMQCHSEQGANALENMFFMHILAEKC